MTIGPALYERLRAHFGQEHRYRHTIAVARTADILAQRHYVDARKARVAGLLHDLARLFPADRLIAECTRRGIPIDEFARANPVVLHAPLGAALAQQDYGINDAEILSAIRRHTLGDARMSALDKVVYLADSLEPGRTFPERADFFALALRDLDDGMRAVLLSSLAYQKARGHAIAPQTNAALEEYHLIHA